MRILKLTVLFVVLSFFSCEKTENIDEILLKTWKLEWKQCGIYQNKYDTKINFTQIDSLYFGWFLQQGEDTIKFDVEIYSNEKLILPSFIIFYNILFRNFVWFIGRISS